MTARDDGFAAALQDMHAKGATGLWADGSDKSLIVGVPGMSGVARALAKNLDVRQLSLVSAVRPSATGWAVHLGEEKHSFDYVVITVPAPQIVGLLGRNHAIVLQIADVRFAPCLTLMAAVNNLPPLVTLNDNSHALAWIAQDGSKPSRPQGTVSTWVAHARVDFSTQYLEEDNVSSIARMLPLLCDRLCVSTAQVTYAGAHRWRYARVTAPLGQPFLRASKSLYAGGDWCIGPRVEAAWTSGDAIDVIFWNK